MKKYNIAYIVTLTLLILSCDPMDNRMLVYNNSSDDIFVRMIFINKDVK